MYTLVLAGGTGSGKSTAADELARLGARRIDLDAVSREVLAPGSPCLAEVAAAFGDDLLLPGTGALDRALLAHRVFAEEEKARHLEEIELPHIRKGLDRALDAASGEGRDGVCVVEVPLLDRMEGSLEFADEVLLVACPLGLRRDRAVGRGMSPADFDRRVTRQPSDRYLRAHADTVIENVLGRDVLVRQLRLWWAERERGGWAGPAGRRR